MREGKTNPKCQMSAFTSHRKLIRLWPFDNWFLLFLLFTGWMYAGTLNWRGNFSAYLQREIYLNVLLHYIHVTILIFFVTMKPFLIMKDVLSAVFISSTDNMNAVADHRNSFVFYRRITSASVDLFMRHFNISSSVMGCYEKTLSSLIT